MLRARFRAARPAARARAWTKRSPRSHVVAEHVAARAGRRQQHRVARPRERDTRDRHGVARASPRGSTSTPAPRSARSISGASRPMQHDRARMLRATAGTSGEKSCPLPSPPAISTDLPAHAFERRDRRGDGRAFAIVDVGDAARSRRRASSGAAGRGTTRAPRRCAAPSTPIASTERQRGERVQRVVTAGQRAALVAAAAASPLRAMRAASVDRRCVPRRRPHSHVSPAARSCAERRARRRPARSPSPSTAGRRGSAPARPPFRKMRALARRSRPCRRASRDGSAKR